MHVSDFRPVFYFGDRGEKHAERGHPDDPSPRLLTSVIYRDQVSKTPYFSPVWSLAPYAAVKADSSPLVFNSTVFSTPSCLTFVIGVFGKNKRPSCASDPEGMSSATAPPVTSKLPANRQLPPESFRVTNKVPCPGSNTSTSFVCVAATAR